MAENNDLFSSMPRPETVLSHYTSLDGFLNIIKENQIRASNILFLNDTEEMEYGIKMAKEVMAKIVPAKKSRALTSLNEIPDVYACCFCEQPDMLSQWRGYGASGQSVSIQFNAHQLENLAKANELELHKVVYGKKQAIELLRDALKRAPSTASIVRALIGTKDESAYTEDDARRTAILDLAPRFKNDAFKEEQEWRIIAKAHTVKKVEYRTRDNVILPYVNIGSATGLPIARVTIGPGKDAELTRKSVDKFLSQNPFYRDVEVAVSKIPFRS